MKKFDEEHLTDEFLVFIRNWVKLLSENNFTEACRLLDKPLSSDEAITWNAESLKQVFFEYTGNQKMPLINNPYQMDTQKEAIYFYQYDDGSRWRVEYDIPIDNEWGDLTAQFSFTKVVDVYAIVLYDIHVL